MQATANSSPQVPGNQGFIRDPLTVGVLTFVAPLIYEYWWYWQLFRFARAERLPHVRSYLAIFVPLLNFVVLFRLFHDVEQRLDPQLRGSFHARTPVLMLIVGRTISVLSLGLPEPYRIALVILSFAFPAFMIYRVQSAVNRYLLHTDPLRVAQRTGFGEVAAVVLGVTLLGLDVLGAARAMNTPTDSSAVSQATPFPSFSASPSPSPTPTPSAGPFPSTGDGFTMISELGDWVGKGGAFTWDGQSAKFSLIDANQPPSEVWVQVTQGDHMWWIELGPAKGQNLRVGTYTDVVNENDPFREAPGLNVSGDSAACNFVYGSFTITRLSKSATGELLLLDATFVQHCEHPDAPSLQGRIRYVKP